MVRCVGNCARFSAECGNDLAFSDLFAADLAVCVARVAVLAYLGGDSVSYLSFAVSLCGNYFRCTDNISADGAFLARCAAVLGAGRFLSRKCFVGMLFISRLIAA